MTDTTGFPTMAKKKSEVRRHSGMARVDMEALDQARLAASLMRISLADYLSDLIRKHAGKDIDREIRKIKGSRE